jgi:hypothetical protein
MLKWLETLFVSKAKKSSAETKTHPTEQPKRKSKSHSRSHSKRVRERERDLRRDYTGQKGEWKKFIAKGGFAGSC